MRKVLIVDFNATAPTYNYYFVKGLLEEGLDVVVLGNQNKSFTAIHEDKIEYKGIFSGIKLLDYTLNWVMLFFIARKYQAIHFQWLPMLKFSSVELVLINKLKKVNRKIFYTIHNFFPHNSEDIKINRRYIQLYKSLDHLIVHTDATTLKLLEHIGDKKTVKIQHGYFYAEFRRAIKKNKKYDLAMLGNILPYKGVEDAIEAIAIIKKTSIIVNLIVAGKCSYEYQSSLEQLIREKGLKDQVKLEIGFLSNKRLMEYYADSSISIMPYKEIEQSGVLYTSLGLAVPIVGYNLGGFSETIVNDKNGFLVEKNNVIALSEKIIEALSKSEKWSTYINEYNNKDIWRENAKILKAAYFDE